MPRIPTSSSLSFAHSPRSTRCSALKLRRHDYQAQARTVQTATSGGSKASFPICPSSHNGLRGLLAVHVTLFHYLNMLDWPEGGINTGGNIHMPFFFLLSGFSLASVHPTVTSVSRFWRNRAARCIPLFWLCSFLAAPLSFSGYGPHPSHLIEALLYTAAGTATWCNGSGRLFAGVGWTVCTLSAFYWMYPWLPKEQPRWLRTRAASASLGLLVGLSLLYSCLPSTGDSHVEGTVELLGWAGEHATVVAVAVAILGGVAAAVGVLPCMPSANQWSTQLFWLQLALGVVAARGVPGQSPTPPLSQE